MAEEDLNSEKKFEELAGMTDMYDPAKIGIDMPSLTPMFPNSISC